MNRINRRYISILVWNAFSIGSILMIARAITPITAALAQGSVYYVDQNHPSASDSNPGTEGSPWLTIQHAADVASAGDTIYIKAGFYPERVRPQNSGAPGSRINFIALPRRMVTMFGFYTEGADYLHLQGFKITSDDSLTGWTDIYGVFIRSDYVDVIDNYFFDVKSTAIQGYWHDPYPVSAYVAENTIYHSQMGIAVTGFDWLVEGNEVERLFDYGGGDSDYSRFFGDNHIIQHNYFHGTMFNEIGAAHVDCFQTFDNNGEYVHNVVIDGNRCSEFHQGFMGEAHYFHDISNITFKNNVFVHGLAWGLSVEDISYLNVYNNTFVDIQYHGVGLSGDYAHHAVIRNNIFYDTGTSYWFPDASFSEGDYNLIFGSDDPPVSGVHDLIDVAPLFANLYQDDFHLQPDSPARDAGMQLPEVSTDLDGIPRPQEAGWDIGAFEFQPNLALYDAPASQAIRLSWDLNVTLPLTSTWEIVYEGGPGNPPSPISGILGPARAFTLTDLTNYTWYSVTLKAILGGSPVLTDTVLSMPTDLFAYLGIILKTP